MPHTSHRRHRLSLPSLIESVLNDARFALRLLRKDAVVAGAAIVSLGLAIGAAIAAFSLVDALVLRPLPVREPQRLVYLRQAISDPAQAADMRIGTLFSHPALQQFREAARDRAEIFGLGQQRPRWSSLPDSGGGRVERLRVQWISGDAFPILGVTPAIGRLLTPDDDRRPGEHQVAVISHQLWERRFARDPGVLGRWIEIEREPFQIVGVTQQAFTGVEPGILTDAWVPAMMWRRQSLTSASDNWLRVWGRLRPGVTAAQLQPIVQGSFTQFRRQLAARSRSDTPRDQVDRYINTPISVLSAATGPSSLRAELQRPLLILAVVVGLVLLIAGSNVANLQLARSAAREREIALRLSIGAGRARLVQQAMIESGLLAVAATTLGLLFATSVAPAIVTLLAPSDLPAYLDLRPDAPVVGFASAVCGLTTMVFGLMAGRRAARVSVVGGLVAGGSRFSARGGVLRPLVIAQVAFSLMALFVAGLLLRSFDRLLRVDAGLAKTGVLLLTIDRERRAGDSNSAARAAGSGAEPSLGGQPLIDRVREIPGVEAAGLAGFPLFKGISTYAGLRVAGRAPEGCAPLALDVSPGFFDALRIDMVAGRDFGSREIAAPESPAAIVNEAFVKRCLPRGTAIGARFERVTLAQTLVPLEVVGVVRDAKYNSMREAARPTLYLPLRDADGTLYVRSRVALAPIAARLRAEIPRLDPSLRVTEVTEQATLVADTLLRERLLAFLSAFLAALGLVLAAVGLYGVLSYAVVRRTREIGIRLALGAPRTRVVRSILADVALLTIAGVVAGLGGGLFLSRFVRTLLFDVEPFAASSLALPTACLLLVALAAACLPARRATRVNPTVALRVD